jgi:hypothetical protein
MSTGRAFRRWTPRVANPRHASVRFPPFGRISRALRGETPPETVARLGVKAPPSERPVRRYQPDGTAANALLIRRRLGEGLLDWGAPRTMLAEWRSRR